MILLAPKPKPINNAEEIVNSAENSDKTTAELNNNPKLAQEEADRIVEWLPNTIDELSPQQKKTFIELVESKFSELNLSFAPKNSESVPDIIPDIWQKQVEKYKDIRKNIDKLPPYKKEALKQAEKEAISKITEDSRNIIDIDK